MNKLFVTLLSTALLICNGRIVGAAREHLTDGVPLERTIFAETSTSGTPPPLQTSAPVPVATPAPAATATPAACTLQAQGFFDPAIVDQSNKAAKEATLSYTLSELPKNIVEVIMAHRSDVIKRAMSSILRDESTGIVFHGTPGTGKTSLVQAIAQHHKMQITYIPMGTMINEYQASGERNLERILGPIIKDSINQRIVLLDEIDQIRGFGDKAQSPMVTLGGLMDISPRNIKYFGTTNNIKDLTPALSSRLRYIIEVPMPPLDYRKAILKILLQNLGTHCTCPEELRADNIINKLAKNSDGLSIRRLETVIIRAKSWAYVRHDDLKAENKPEKASLQESDLWNALKEVKAEQAVTEESRLYKVGCAVERAWPMISTGIGTAQFCISGYQQQKQFNTSHALQLQQMLQAKDQFEESQRTIEAQDELNAAFQILGLAQSKAATKASLEQSAQQAAAALQQAAQQASTANALTVANIISTGTGIGSGIGTSIAVASAAKAAAAGATTGTVAGPAGTVVGGLAGAAIGGGVGLAVAYKGAIGEFAYTVAIDVPCRVCAYGWSTAKTNCSIQ